MKTDGVVVFSFITLSLSFYFSSICCKLNEFLTVLPSEVWPSIRLSKL